MDWYPHYIDDFDADTLHLTLAEDGAYCRLLRWYYKNERPLPTDPVALAGICRVSVEQWNDLAPRIAPLFVTRDATKSKASVMHHKRCDSVILKQNRRRKDWKARQEKLRKHNILEVVTRDSRGSHAPIGEDRIGNTVSKDTVTKHSKPRRTRLAKDWEPNGEDHAVALSEGLTAEEINTDLIEWREYWDSDEPRDPLKVSWSRTYRKHVKQFSAGIIASRARQGRTGGNGARRGGIAAAIGELLAEGGGEVGSGTGLPKQRALSTTPGGGNDTSQEHSGPIIDADG